MIKILKLLLKVILAGVMVILLINAFMILSTIGNITTVDKLTGNYDYVIVLGAGYRNLDTPSLMLEDRIIRGVQAYQKIDGTKLLMSGDSRYPDMHDETLVMKRYAMKIGAPEEDIICDDYGLSTYETMWRARHVYGAEKVIVITQRFHLNRSVYIARALGMEVTGISADIQKYSAAKIWYNIREMAARCKDFIWCITQPDATFTE